MKEVGKDQFILKHREFIFKVEWNTPDSKLRDGSIIQVRGLQVRQLEEESYGTAMDVGQCIWIGRDNTSYLMLSLVNFI